MLTSQISQSQSLATFDPFLSTAKREHSAPSSCKQRKNFILARDIKKYENEFQQKLSTERTKSNLLNEKNRAIQNDKKTIRIGEPTQQPITDRVSYFSLEKKQEKERDQGELPLMGKSLISMQSTVSLSGEEFQVNDKNIFLEKNNPINKQLYKEFNIGPRFDKDGKIIQYTLVGNTAWYNKQKDLVEKNSKTKGQPGRESIKKLENDSQIQKSKTLFHSKNSSIPSTKNLITQNSSNMDKSLVIPRPDTTQSVTVKAQQTKKKKKGDAGQEVSKEELEKEFLDLEKRHILLENEEEKIVNKMPLDQKNIFTRNERVMKSYDNHVKDWDKTIKAVTQQSDRTPETSCMLRGENFRRRLEFSNAYESLKTSDELYGQRIWYMHLRRYQHDKKNEEEPPLPLSSRKSSRRHLTTEVSSGSETERNSIRNNRHTTENITYDIFNGFNSIVINTTGKEIEVIRKPKDPSNFHLSSSTGFSAFNKFSSLHYVEGQVRDQVSKLRGRMILLDSPVDDLFIQGTNKLEAEKQSLLNSNKPKIFNKVLSPDGEGEQLNLGWGGANNTPMASSFNPNQKVTINSPQASQKIPEVIGEDYNIHKLSRQGKHFYPNILQKLQNAESKIKRE